ncbi:hypothetical protein FK535_12470 [Mycolicibacterium sp. 018/SC-01/001]|uniref:hypothetical protein n=1 Tax=Mycolicibacterium sp. 018/SC-01/001 TaxID=2592069 RepID=UPI00117CBF61|nr:hypothetical protein [Mycolicibacterium sp. 018/SC-01/001]TRW82771.1 hypothetical protein FK535_12470 [Mycolicibacterium sp. 018/SC-01/001]
MKLIERGNAVVAVAAIAGSALLANPVQVSEHSVAAGLTAEVDLTASSTALQPWPALPPLARTPDQIDDDFLAARLEARAEFTAFANELGYLGKQLYIGYNLIESILASAVFNGTDVARGEGLLRNIGQFAGDVLLSAAFVAIDEISLASPDTYPIAITRPPTDRPAGWTDALAPNRNDPLTVPGGGATSTEQAAVAAGPTPFLDGIDNAFIDGTILFRTAVTPVLNLLGPIGKQIYIGVNFAESVLASAVFNGTDILRGEGLFRNLGSMAVDVANAGLWVVIDEFATVNYPDAVVLTRAPGDRPARWEDADAPFIGPLTVPDRGQDDLASTVEAEEPVKAGDTDAAQTDRPEKPSLLSDWKAKREARAEQRAQAKAENAEKREQRREAREARRAARADKTEKAEKTSTADSE